LIFIISIAFTGEAMTHPRAQESVPEPRINIDILPFSTLHYTLSCILFPNLLHCEVDEDWKAAKCVPALQDIFLWTLPDFHYDCDSW